jgi:hypothetical protein
MRRELKAMDRALTLHDVRSLRSVVDASLARQRFGMIPTTTASRSRWPRRD